MPQICKALQAAIAENKDKILAFPYLSRQDDVRFILWSLISSTVWSFERDITGMIKNKHFFDIPAVHRAYSCAAVAFRDDNEEEAPRFDFYGCDGIDASSVGGYRHVYVSNIYGKRVDKHFHCGHNFSNDPKLILTLRAIGGLSIDDLDDNEKEIAAKAIECGYIRKNENDLEPKIIVVDKKDERDFYSLSNLLQNNMGEIKEKIAEELSVFMKDHIPEHLMCEYQIYIELIAGIRILSRAIEECIEEGLLSEPENKNGGEGVLMVVEE